MATQHSSSHTENDRKKESTIHADLEDVVGMNVLGQKRVGGKTALSICGGKTMSRVMYLRSIIEPGHLSSDPANIVRNLNIPKNIIR